VNAEARSIVLSQTPTRRPGIGASSIKLMSFSDGQIRTLVSFQGDRGSFSMYGRATPTTWHS
jgi:hypothetical protein